MKNIEFKETKIGHFTDLEHGTGCTVVICEKGAVCGVDVRGGAPGTRETDLLDPVNMVEKAYAIYIGGGSAFGLDGAGGVMKYLEEKGIGFDATVTKVPIVPGAIVFDLAVGNPSARPNSEMGYKACLNAKENNGEQGNVGAGTGCTVGKVLGMERCMKAGLGVESIKVDRFTVSALAVVNAFGDIINPETGQIIAGAIAPEGNRFLGTESILIQENIKEEPFKNTTIGVIVTDAVLTKASAKRIAMMAHDALARTIRPSHTMFDGDTIFVLSVGTVEENVSRVGTIAAKALERAILNAVKNADTLFGIPSYKDIQLGKEK